MTTLGEALLTVAEYATSKGEHELADWCSGEREQLTEARARHIKVGAIAMSLAEYRGLSDDELAELGQRVMAAIEQAK